MKKFLILFIVISISISGLYSQNKTVKGRVISNFFDIMTIVSIRINDTVEVGTPDKNGFFQIEIPISENKISFMGPGIYPSTIGLLDSCDKIEIVIMLNGSSDFISLKRAERKRRKRFKKIPKIHKEAYKRGLFETEYPCYNRKFESFYLRKK